MWYVYIILTQAGKLYTGITTDLERRFAEHSQKKGAKFFHTDIPVRIVFTEKCESRSLAQQREYAIKKLSRKEKCALFGNCFD